MKRTFILVSVAVAVAFTGACGGGGGSKSTTPTFVPTPIPAKPPLSISTTGLNVGVQGDFYMSTVAAVNGATPYTFAVQGALPPGVSFSNSGTFLGPTTQPGTFPVNVTVTDSATPAVTANKSFTIAIVPRQTVRNDSLGSANDITCCGTLFASLSPYSKATGMAAADQDYYRITANPGDRVSVDTVAIGTVVDTDTLIEILDASGARMNTCKTPQAPAAFASPCLNDDVNPGVVRGSHLDVQLPSTSGVFVVHVLDWLGRARPEMTYELRTVKLP